MSLVSAPALRYPLLDWNICIYHLNRSESNLEINVWKTGGFLYLFPGWTSPDMTQPAKTIYSIISIILSTTVFNDNDVVN